MRGRYIWINGEWEKIKDYYNPDTVQVDRVYAEPGSAVSDIVLMNSLSITPDTTMEITRLDFSYLPTFR